MRRTHTAQHHIHAAAYSIIIHNVKRETEKKKRVNKREERTKRKTAAATAAVAATTRAEQCAICILDVRPYNHITHSHRVCVFVCSLCSTHTHCKGERQTDAAQINLFNAFAVDAIDFSTLWNYKPFFSASLFFRFRPTNMRARKHTINECIRAQQF